jgi:hypothetical protein
VVVEAGDRPDGEQFAEGSQHDQSGVNQIDALVEQTRLSVSDIGQYYDMWVGLLSESEGDIPQHLTETIRNVSYGLGFLFYQHWGEMGYTGRSKQVAFQKRLARHNIDQFTLPYEDALQLQRAASLVNVEYDPGESEDTPENLAKRTFRLAGSEAEEPPQDTIV